MHKVHRDYKYVEQIRDGFCYFQEGFRSVEGRVCSNWNTEKRNGALNAKGAQSIKGSNTESARRCAAR
jgi:hypothetical protein